MFVLNPTFYNNQELGCFAVYYITETDTLVLISVFTNILYILFRITHKAVDCFS